MKRKCCVRASLERLEPRRLLATDLGEILFLGDSITHGAGYEFFPSANFDSYRYEFWKDLVDPPPIPNSAETFEFEFEFVGSQDSFFGFDRTLPDHNGHSFPNIHEGHFGWTATQIRDNLDGWMVDYDADLVFIHLATNDLKAPLSIAPSITRIGEVIDKLQNDNPNVTVLVAQILPYYKGPPQTTNPLFPTEADLDAYNDRIIAFNTLVDSTVASWSTASSRVYAVEQHNLDPLPNPSVPEDPANWIPISHFVDYVHPNSGIGAQTMADRWFAALQTIPPTVTDVRLSSTTWESDFVNEIDSEGLGYRIPNGTGQSAPLPWVDLDRIHVTFEEEVVIDESDVSLAGILGETYTLGPGSVSFDDTTNTATINLPPNLTRDVLALTISDSVTDLTGNALDGEWVDNQTIARSGNGIAGGDFVFTFKVLPGDATQNEFVSGSDLSLARALRFAIIGAGNYNSLADINGDGFIGASDISAIRGRRFDSLIPPAAASVESLFADPPAKRRLGHINIDAVFAEKQDSRRRAKSRFGLGTSAAFLA